MSNDETNISNFSALGTHQTNRKSKPCFHTKYPPPLDNLSRKKRGQKEKLPASSLGHTPGQRHRAKKKAHVPTPQAHPLKDIWTVMDH
jgi:hypothetical protein